MIEGFDEYFLPADEIGPFAAIIEGSRIYRIVGRDDVEVRVESFDDGEDERVFTREEIERRTRDGSLVLEEGYFDLANKITGTTSGYRLVGQYPAARQVEAIFYSAVAQRLADHYLTGKTKLSDRALLKWRSDNLQWSIEEMGPILKRMGLKDQAGVGKAGEKLGSRFELVMKLPMPTKLRDDRRKLLAAQFAGEEVLPLFIDNREHSTKGGLSIDPEVGALARDVATYTTDPRGNPYGTETKQSFTALLKRLRIKLDKANEDRAVKLRLPAPSTFNKIVTSVPAIRHLIARDGPNLARQSLAMVSQGPRYTRIGEHMEMDFWEGHLMALFKHNGAWANLEDEVKAILKPIRVYIALVFDVCTGCIMGLSFSLSESSEAALTALRMVVSDRSAIAAWAGCQRDWLAPVRGDRLQTDGGSPFKSPIFWTAAATCFLQVRKKAGAHKRLNGHVERIFQTMDKQLMANFTGRTFSNVVDKGDYNPEARAALIVDELAKCVIRYVVDDYHLTKPDAPLAQSPYRKFWRLYREKGFKPPPSKDRLRASFGIRKKVELDRWGIRYANLFYTRSTLLEDFLAEEGEQMVTIMVDPLDLGEISVKAGRKWIAVGGPPEVRGIGVHEWEAFNRYMERQYKAEAELDWPVVAEALQSYDRVRGEALERAGIKDLQMTSDKMDAIARSMRLRFVSEARLTTQDGQPRSVARGTVGKSVYPSNRPQLPAPTDLADSPTSPPPFSDVAEAETIIPVESVDEQSSKPSKGSWGLLDD